MFSNSNYWLKITVSVLLCLVLSFYNLYYLWKHPPVTPRWCMENPDTAKNTRLDVYGIRVLDVTPGKMSVNYGKDKFFIVGEVEEAVPGSIVNLKLLYLGGKTFKLIFLHNDVYREYRVIVSAIILILVIIVFFEKFEIRPGYCYVFVEKRASKD